MFAGEGKEEVAGWIEGYLWKIEGDDDEVRMSAGDVGEGITAEATDEDVPSRDEQGSEPVDEVAAKAAKLEV
jgi:hypothetical protein